jgi:hypothetical protein
LSFGQYLGNMAQKTRTKPIGKELESRPLLIMQEVY